MGFLLRRGSCPPEDFLPPEEFRADPGRPFRVRHSEVNLAELPWFGATAEDRKELGRINPRGAGSRLASGDLNYVPIRSEKSERRAPLLLLPAMGELLPVLP